MTTASEVRDILRHPEGRPWTLQGFGMLRLYLDDGQVGRLHIWDADMSVTDVSTVHDHPWDLDSRIISGRLFNQRYVHLENADNAMGGAVEKWNAVLIRTGEGGHPLEAPTPWLLERQQLESYLPGDAYHQDAPEIHESIPMRGTVTVVERTFSRQRDIATSLFKDTPEWVSAEPRPATPEEVLHFTHLALENWNG